MTSEITICKEDLLRVNVVGVSGSGKSWFASKLADALQSSYLQMDQLYWQPNWEEPSAEEFRVTVEAAIGGDQWVLDGNYHSKTRDLKWQRATSVVWIDNSFPLTVWQAVSRACNRAWSGKELWPGTGNCESFRRSFLSTDSVVLWTLKTYFSARRRYQAVQAESDQQPFRFFRLRGRKAASEFLERAQELSVS